MVDTTQKVLDLIGRRDYDGVQALVETFQLQPGLIDGFLPSVVELLANVDDAPGLALIYTLTKVRGFKVVTQLLPSDPALLNRLIQALETKISWQVRYVLLLWLSIVIMAPFDLAVWGPDTAARVQKLTLESLVKSGKERDAAALVMARLLLRSRSSTDLATFLSWAVGATGFKQLGVLQTMAIVAQSLDLETFISEVGLLDATGITTSTTDKLRLKILGRAALRPQASPEFVEAVVEQVIYGLDDSSVSVRMSAGKYIARLAAHLSATQENDPAPDIFAEILGIFDQEPRIDTTWQGGLIGMAEMVRRGYNFTSDAPQIIAVLEEALHFSQSTLRKTYGSNVRDAACYVCWAMFRSSSNFERDALYGSLIGLACFDSEVNIRRAAAAALQEGIGRQENGASTEDLALIQQINFQSVTSVSRSYLEIAPAVNADPKYLMRHGFESEDADIRRLAAQAVSVVDISAYLPTFKSWLKGNRQDRRHAALLGLAALGDAQPEYVDPPQLSDLYYEGALIQYSLMESPDIDRVVTCMKSDAPAVLAAAKTFAARLPPQDAFIQAWMDAMEESSSFVAAICAYPHPSELRTRALIKAATTLQDARPRSWAVAEITALDVISAGLDDYQIDKRGDVGSWVREAASRRVLEVWASAPDDWKQTVVPKIWRLAGERSDRARTAATDALVALGLMPDHSREFSGEHVSLLLDAAADAGIREAVLAGIVSTAGAIKVSQNTLSTTLSALVAFHTAHEWMLIQIMRLDRSKHAGVVICLERLLARGVEPRQWQSLLAIAVNTTIQVRDSQILKSAIQILGWLAPRDSRATDRLVKLCAHSHPIVRQRAAEALFEAGYENEVLETTDWSLPNPPQLKLVE